MQITILGVVNQKLQNKYSGLLQERSVVSHIEIHN